MKERIAQLERENKSLKMAVADLKVKVSKKERDLNKLMNIIGSEAKEPRKEK